MIVRTWHGAVLKEHAKGFRNYLQSTGIAEAKTIPGNKGVYIIFQ